MSYEYEWDEIEIVVKEDYEKIKRKAQAFNEILNLPDTYGYAEDYAEDVDIILSEYMERVDNEDREYKNAWQTFKEMRIQEYIKLHRTVNQVIKPNNQYHLFQLVNAMVGRNDLAHILKEMDKLDGTQDFNNLLSDLEDE